MYLGHLTDQKFYSDKDMTMLSCYVGNNMYSLCNRGGSNNYLVQYTKQGVIFKVDNPDMAHKIMKLILIGETKCN